MPVKHSTTSVQIGGHLSSGVVVLWLVWWWLQSDILICWMDAQPPIVKEDMRNALLYVVEL